jgi:hypothetical protein
LEHLGVRVEEAATPAEARHLASRPGGAAFEAALYAGPADGRAKTHAIAVAGLVRPGRNSLAVARAEDLIAAPPADALRLPDRRGLMRSAGPGGWVLHTVPGAAEGASRRQRFSAAA